MPKSEPILMDSLLLPARPEVSVNKTKIRKNSNQEAILGGDWDSTEWAFCRPNTDQESTELDPKSRDRSSHAQALVSQMPRDQAATRDSTLVDVTFTEDDPRACPRDLEEFRLAIALELDRLRDNKKIYDL